MKAGRGGRDGEQVRFGPLAFLCRSRSQEFHSTQKSWKRLAGAVVCALSLASIGWAQSGQARVENPFATPWLMSQREEPVAASVAVEAVRRPIGELRVPVERLQPELDAATLKPQLDRPEKQQAKVQQLTGKYDVSKIGDRGVGGGVNFYSLDKETTLGKELSNEVEKSSHLLTDPVVTEYVNRVGQNLVRHSDAKVPFVIKVVDDDQINAFALPGGFFYVNTGVIMAAENEAELAGVMAHEIAHVAARHATKNATKAEIWNLASLPLIFVGGAAGMAVRNLAGIAVPMSFLKFGRDAEREADLLGLEYEYAAGYDPAAFVNFFEKLQASDKKKHGFIARAFSTHPMNDERMRRAQKEMEMLPPRDEYIVTTSEFDDIKARVAMLTQGKRIDPADAGKPTLKKKTEEKSGDEEQKPPVLKR